MLTRSTSVSSVAETANDYLSSASRASFASGNTLSLYTCPAELLLFKGDSVSSGGWNPGMAIIMAANAICCRSICSWRPGDPRCIPTIRVSASRCAGTSMRSMYLETTQKTVYSMVHPVLVMTVQSHPSTPFSLHLVNTWCTICVRPPWATVWFTASGLNRKIL